jgi:hypothetical protein
MKTYVYTFEDSNSGIPLYVEVELVDFQDDEPPVIVLQSVTYSGEEVAMWCLSEDYKKNLQNTAFQMWCFSK